MKTKPSIRHRETAGTSPRTPAVLSARRVPLRKDNNSSDVQRHRCLYQRVRQPEAEHVRDVLRAAERVSAGQAAGQAGVPPGQQVRQRPESLTQPHLSAPAFGSQETRRPSAVPCLPPRGAKPSHHSRLPWEPGKTPLLPARPPLSAQSLAAGLPPRTPCAHEPAPPSPRLALVSPDLSQGTAGHPPSRLPLPPGAAWDAAGRSVGCHWAQCRMLLGTAWDAAGRSVGCSRAQHGMQPGAAWDAAWRSVGCSRAQRGMQPGAAWDAAGRSMGCSRAQRGMQPGAAWDAAGRSVGCLWLHPLLRADSSLRARGSGEGHGLRLCLPQTPPRLGTQLFLKEKTL